MIEVDEYGSIMCTGEHVTLFRYIAIESALHFEVKTGMPMRKGISKVARQILQDAGIKPARKIADLYEQFARFRKDSFQNEKQG